MLSIPGYLKDGTPTLSIGLGGVYSEAPTEFEAVIDTGFSGFISMPLIKAFPLGLPLTGSTNVILADGNIQSKLMASAQAFVAGRKEFGLVILEPSSNELLLGMDFLRAFKMALFLTSSGIILLDESEFAKYAQEQKALSDQDTPNEPAKPGTKMKKK